MGANIRALFMVMGKFLKRLAQGTGLNQAKRYHYHATIAKINRELGASSQAKRVGIIGIAPRRDDGFACRDGGFLIIKTKDR